MAELKVCLKQQKHLWRIEHDSHYHHDAELGWCDLENEAELRDMNDNLLKMIEGDGELLGCQAFNMSFHI